MKKLTYLSALVLAAGMTACSQYEEPNPQIPVTPEEQILNVDGITVASSQYLAANEETGDLATIDLDAYGKLGYPIQLADVTVDESQFPAGYKLYFKAWLADNENFANAQEVPCTLNNGVITTTADDLQVIYENMFGRKSEVKEMWVRYAGYVDGENVSNIRLNGSDYYYAPQAFYMAPIPPDFVVEPAYYLLGTINGWSVGGALQMNHSGKDVYDDPVFTYVVDLDGSEWWWKVVPQSTYETGNWVDGDDAAFGVATNGDGALSGKLVGRTATEDCGAGCLNGVVGKYVMVINLEMMTYEFAPVYDFLYTPGDANGWSQAASAKIYPTPTGAAYESWMPLKGSFKFTTQPDWNGINFGAGAEAGTLSTDGGAGNLTVSDEGYYCVRMSTVSMTWETVYGPVQSWGVIGGFAASGWGTDVPMTTVDGQIWKATVTFAAGDEFKFRADGAWDIQYGNGGNGMDDLVCDGGSGNLTAPAAGTFEVTLDLSKVPYHATLTAI
jgi:hypothetical protein